MKTRRIAVVSDGVMPFHKGGKEMRIYQLTQRLVRCGFQVDIYTMKWWQGGDTYQENGVTYHALCRLYPLYAGARRSIPQAILFSLSCLKLIRYDFDILEVDHMPVFPLFTAKLVSVVKRRPMYATFHEIWGKDYWQEYLGTYKGLVAYLLELMSVKMPDHIIAVSDHVRQQIQVGMHYRGPITLVRNAIDMHEVDQVPPAAHKVDVLFVGRLLPHKHVDMLIEAVAQIIPDFPKLSCMIIGGGPEKERLESLVHSLGLQKHVKVTGVVESNVDVIAQIKSAKVFATPSSREGFGITVLEALACGSRIVTVDSPNNASKFLVAPDRGTVCALTVDNLACALRKELLLASGSNVRKASTEEYDWSASARALDKVYAS